MPLKIMQLLTATFLAVLFLQSGIDKVVDRKGNVEWLKGHFANSPLANFVEAMVSTITLVELVAGGASALGAALLLMGGSSFPAFVGAVTSSVAIVMLFFGQRLAKDYEGAAVLANYFLLTLAAIYITG
jgi:hypothetical protein